MEARIHETLEYTDFSNKLCNMCERWGACLPELQKNCNKLKKYEPVKVKTGYHVFNHAEKLSLDEMISKADMKMLSKQWEAWKKFRAVKIVSTFEEQESYHEVIEIAMDWITEEERLDEIILSAKKHKLELQQKKEEA